MLKPSTGQSCCLLITVDLSPIQRPRTFERQCFVRIAGMRIGLVGHCKPRCYASANEKTEYWDEQNANGNNDERFPHCLDLELFRRWNGSLVQVCYAVPKAVKDLLLSDLSCG
jgi:hypothetical protein